MAWEPWVMLLTGKPLFLSGGNDFSILNQTCRAIMVKSRDPENMTHGPSFAVCRLLQPHHPLRPDFVYGVPSAFRMLSSQRAALSLLRYSLIEGTDLERRQPQHDLVHSNGHHRESKEVH